MERVAGTQNDSHQTEQLELVVALAATNHQDTDGDDGYQIHSIKTVSTIACIVDCSLLID